MKSRLWTDTDVRYMREALDLARAGASEGEVPVGAVVVCGGEVIGRGCNRPILSKDPTAHAEIEAIRSAARAVGNYRLIDSTLYVTMEPCIMCAGAIVNARIRRLVFAARDIRFGAVRSCFQLCDWELSNHQVEVEEGLLAAECAETLKEFFESKR